MEIKEYIRTNEKIYKSKRNIKYLFCKGKNSNKLIVTFPALQAEGKRPPYNYMGTLMDCSDHKLFLLDDFGSRGSYLISENRDDSIETSVVSLILSVCKEYNIKLENVILQGSSKGGYSALYFGLKYRFGYVIAGAPQTKLGDFLVIDAPVVAQFMAGGQEEEDIRYLNNLLFNLLYLPSTNFPKIFIHIGSGDYHYKNHILPFIKELDKKGINYQLDVANYFYHSSAVIYYPDYLVKTLRDINNEISLKPLINNVTIKFENNLLKLTCDAEGQNLEYACYIFKHTECIEKIMYQKENTFKYPVNSEGIYCARLYVKDAKNHINYEFTDEIRFKYSNEQLSAEYLQSVS